MAMARLLERIERRAEGPQRRTPEAGTLDSVLAHLRKLLNSGQGNAPIAPDFGAPDFLAMLPSFPDSVSTMEEAIRLAIERYEPRLADVEVHFHAEETETVALRFEIAGALRGSGVEERISFESSVDLHGQVRILGAAGDGRRQPVVPEQGDGCPGEHR